MEPGGDAKEKRGRQGASGLEELRDRQPASENVGVTWQ